MSDAECRVVESPALLSELLSPFARTESIVHRTFSAPHFHAGRRAFKGDSSVETGRGDRVLNITLTALNNGIQATSFGALSIENCNINGGSGGIVIAGKQRRQRGLAVPPLADVQEDIRTTLKSTRLQQEVDKWTTELRSRANMDIYTWR
jgi:hypothetical protein